MAEHPHVELVQRAYRAGSEGDIDTVSESCASDFVIYVPGNTWVSGEYTGRDAMRQISRQMRDGTDGTLRWDLRQMFVDGRGHAVSVSRMTAERQGRHLDQLQATLSTIVGGRLSSAELFQEDLDAFDEFWGDEGGAQARR
jgi:ketosteroid isomerase-like protein